MKLNDYICDDYFSRSDLINFMTGLYGYKSYLEIGVDDGRNFERVHCAYKVGVDPADKYDKITFNMTSDDFFVQNTETFDIIFIDGLHVSDQVIKDIENSLSVLNDKGTIIMHDCLPNSEAAQSRVRLGDHWNGDVWKAFAHYRSNPNLSMFTLDTDQGLGFIKKGKQEEFSCPDNIDYSYFVKHRNSLMKVLSVSTSLKTIRELHKHGF